MSKVLLTVEIIGKRGRLEINESDLPEWRAKGYKLLSEAKKAQGTGNGPAAVDFSKYQIAELKGFGQLANIEGSDNMNKKQLVEALTAANYKPE